MLKSINPKATKEPFLKIALEQMEDGVITFIAEEGIVYLNKAARQVYGITNPSININEFYCEGLNYDKEKQLIKQEDIPLYRIISGEVLKHEEFWLRSKNGKLYNLLVCGNQIVIDQEVIGAVLSLHDNTHYKAHEEKITYYAFYDFVTDLPNRRKLKDILEQLIYQQQSSTDKLALFFLDLDFFKLVNDYYGHDSGDDLLRDVANRLIKTLPSNAVISRIGGDEFIVAVPNLKDKEGILKVAKSIKAAFIEPFLLDGDKINITTSIGISLYPDDSNEISTLITKADKAMFIAKRNGKNKFHFFTGNKTNETSLTAADLSNALIENQFRLLYQPKVNAETRKIDGVEALLRWDHPTLGTVPPDKFIPLAEDTDLIIPIGEWVLKEACLQAKVWEGKGLPQIRIAVNISPIQFQSDTIIGTVKRILEDTKFNPRLLELEITERITMKDIRFVTDTLNKLDQLGVRIALDDFGIGFSSLNYLKNFPIDLIKIDKSFIRDCVTSEKDAFIIKAIITMAKGLNVNVLAEGVETKEQYKLVSLLGCDEIQGYYFSKPITPVQIEQKLASEKFY